MKFTNPYWSVQTRMDLLARWLIVHSIIYYELGTSIIEDGAWDSNARQYVDLAWEHPDHAARTRWNYVMHDFDASTGFHLYSRLNRNDKKMLKQQAMHLVDRYGTSDRRQKSKRKRGKLK